MPAAAGTGAASATPAETSEKRPGSRLRVHFALPEGTSSSQASDKPKWDGPEPAGNGVAGSGDPFVNGAPREYSKLNGEAVVFSPGLTGPATGHAGQVSNMIEAEDADDGPVIVSSDGRSFTARRPAKRLLDTIGPRAMLPRRSFNFTTDTGPGVDVPGGHYIRIDFQSPSELEKTLKALYERFKLGSKLRGCVAPPSESTSVSVYLSFDDIRYAEAGLGEIEIVNSACNAVYITQPEYAHGKKTGQGRGVQEPTKFFDGQVTVTAKYGGSDDEWSYNGLFQCVEHIAEQFGEIIGLVETERDYCHRQYNVEFYKISDALEMAENVSPTEPGVYCGWEITCQERGMNPNISPMHHAVINKTPQKNGHDYQYSSPTGRTAWSFDKKGQAVALPGANQLPKVGSVQAGISMTPAGRRIRGSDPSPQTPANSMPAVPFVPRSGSWPSTEVAPKTTPHSRRRLPEFGPNRIDILRIQKGIDVRTTIMVRNIPNEMNADQMKRVIDKVCFGRYDFIYLRFDFRQNKNVGYAFVNFLTPGDVMKFFFAYDGKEYIEGLGRHPVHGPRLGEIAYATCQGQDCAIEKFRNSSIMCEYAGYRPKLFWTVEDAPSKALVGEERTFPGINNLSKHNRSKDNAAQIGLYAPKSRNGTVIVRNSQYDRGTPAQVQEDALFNHYQQRLANMSLASGYNDGYVAAGSTMSMPVGMPISPFVQTFGPPNPFYHSGGAMNGSPQGYSPAAMAYRGSPRTTVRPRFTVRPGRDTETAIREIEEGRRIQAEYEAAKAHRNAVQQAANEMQSGQFVSVPRSMNGQVMPAGEDVQSAHDGGYSHGGHGGGFQNGEYQNGEYQNGEYQNCEYQNGGYQDGAYQNGEHQNGEHQNGGYASNQYQ